MSALIHTTITETCCARPESPAGFSVALVAWSTQARPGDLDRRSTRLARVDQSWHAALSPSLLQSRLRSLSLLMLLMLLMLLLLLLLLPDGVCRPTADVICEIQMEPLK